MTSNNEESTGDKSVAQPAVVVDFHRIERAVLDSTSSLEGFQVAFQSTQADDDAFGSDDLHRAVGQVEVSLDYLSAAVRKAQTTLKAVKPDAQPSPETRPEQLKEGQKASAKWCAGLARFMETSSPLLERILRGQEMYGDFPGQLADELETVTTDYWLPLEQLKAEMEAARGYIESFQELSDENSVQV